MKDTHLLSKNLILDILLIMLFSDVHILFSSQVLVVYCTTTHALIVKLMQKAH